MPTIKERFEALQRYDDGWCDDCNTAKRAEPELAKGEGRLVLLSDVLALADALDAERVQSSGKNLADMIAEATTTAMAKRNSGLEELIKAFLSETGASAADCQLVEEIGAGKLTWRIEMRPKRPPMSKRVK